MKEQILVFIEQYKIIIGVLALLGVEISPIKFNPLQLIGNLFNKPLIKKMEELEQQICILKTNVDTNDIDSVRNRLVADDNLIRFGEHLKYYQYKTIFQDIKKWKAYHIKYPELNGMIDIAISNIEEAYKKEKFKEFDNS